MKNNGGSKNFADIEVERTHHATDLATARDFVTKEVPEIAVSVYLADFDGLYII